MTMLPRQDVPIASGDGRATNPFYFFLQDLERAAAAGPAGLQEQITGIARALGSPDGTVAGIPEQTTQQIGLLIGQQSVRVSGSLANGSVFVMLQGDQDAPGPTYAYGTNAEGEKGWFALADGLLEGEGVALTVDATGRVTFGLAPLPDTGGGALQKLERDQYGRVAGTSEATTDDLPEGEGNRYFTDERARDAAPIQSIVAGTNVTIDATDPANPVISVSGGGTGGAVDSVNGQTGAVVLGAADVGAATAAQGAKADSALQTAVLSLVAGANVTIDAADPERPVISATGGAGPPGPSGSGGILPMVNGEVPPVLMHADDGSLIYSQVA